MFSGIGGFELGLARSRLDHQLVGFSEVDKFAISIYEEKFEGVKNYGDATNIRGDELPDFGLRDFLANHSAWREKGEDLTRLGEHSFLRSQGFALKKNPDMYYLRTLQVYYLMTAGKLSRQFLGFSPIWGMELNGRYLTAKISESPKTGIECSLSDILETEVNTKYFLSQSQVESLTSGRQKSRVLCNIQDTQGKITEA